MLQAQVLDIYKGSFFERWFSKFLMERHAIFSRIIFLLIALLFYAAGPRLIMELTQFLPVAELGSSGASLLSHQILVVFASVLGLSCLILLCKPTLRSLTLDERGISLNKAVLFFPLPGKILAWDKISKVAIERKGADLRRFKLLLESSANPACSIRIPLENLSKDENRDALVSAIQNKARKAQIEPEALETIKPARNFSFTEIWLDALSAAPGRQRLCPLPEESKVNNRFTVKKRLGGGGQATAYLAFDSEKDCNVVLKETILPVYADLPTRKQALAKFHEEALALESIKSPNIVKFIDSFVEDHRAYLVLEYIEGKTLRRFVEENSPMSEADAVSYGIQICRILEALHSLSPPLIHRDLTCDNLILTKEGKLVLIDFAVAVAASAANEVDGSQLKLEAGSGPEMETAGKIAYMAPEQFRGSASEQTDIYSLACCLYYLLAGKDPLPLQVADLSASRADLSSKLCGIVARGTSQLPDTRFRRAKDLAAELESLSAG